MTGHGVIPALIRAAATSGRNAAIAFPALERWTGDRLTASMLKRSAPSPSTRSKYSTSPAGGHTELTVSPMALRIRRATATPGCAGRTRGDQLPVLEQMYPEPVLAAGGPFECAAVDQHTTRAMHGALGHPTRLASSLSPISASPKNASRMSRAIVTGRKGGEEWEFSGGRGGEGRRGGVVLHLRGAGVGGILGGEGRREGGGGGDWGGVGGRGCSRRLGGEWCVCLCRWCCRGVRRSRRGRGGPGGGPLVPRVVVFTWRSTGLLVVASARRHGFGRNISTLLFSIPFGSVFVTSASCRRSGTKPGGGWLPPSGVDRGEGRRQGGPGFGEGCSAWVFGDRAAYWRLRRLESAGIGRSGLSRSCVVPSNRLGGVALTELGGGAAGMISGRPGEIANFDFAGSCRVAQDSLRGPTRIGYHAPRTVFVTGERHGG